MTHTKINLRAAWCWCVCNKGEKQSISRSTGLHGAKWNQGALLLLLRQWSFRIWLESCSELLPWTECWFQAQLSHPLSFSKWHFLVLAQAQIKPCCCPPWCCLLAVSRLLPIHTNVGQDLSCLPEVWSQCKLLSLLHWGKVLLSTCQI